MKSMKVSFYCISTLSFTEEIVNGIRFVVFGKPRDETIQTYELVR